MKGKTQKTLKREVEDLIQAMWMAQFGIHTGWLHSAAWYARILQRKAPCDWKDAGRCSWLTSRQFFKHIALRSSAGWNVLEWDNAPILLQVHNSERAEEGYESGLTLSSSASVSSSISSVSRALSMASSMISSIMPAFIISLDISLIVLFSWGTFIKSFTIFITCTPAHMAFFPSVFLRSVAVQLWDLRLNWEQLKMLGYSEMLQVCLCAHTWLFILIFTRFKHGSFQELPSQLSACQLIWHLSGASKSLCEQITQRWKYTGSPKSQGGYLRAFAEGPCNFDDSQLLSQLCIHGYHMCFVSEQLADSFAGVYELTRYDFGRGGVSSLCSLFALLHSLLLLPLYFPVEGQHSWFRPCFLRLDCDHWKLLWLSLQHALEAIQFRIATVSWWQRTSAQGLRSRETYLCMMYIQSSWTQFTNTLKKSKARPIVLFGPFAGSRECFCGWRLCLSCHLRLAWVFWPMKQGPIIHLIDFSICRCSARISACHLRTNSLGSGFFLKYSVKLFFPSPIIVVDWLNPHEPHHLLSMILFMVPQSLWSQLCWMST